MTFLTRTATALICLAAAGSTFAGNYDESVGGDLSNERLAPSVFTLSQGINTFVMSTQTGDRDYFTLGVPTGFTLSSIFHKTYVSDDNLSFFGLQSGTTLSEPPTGTNAGALLGYALFGGATVNTELIDNLAASGSSTPAAMGFTAPLPSGDYTFWVQQTGAIANYSFDFVLSPVPEPGQWALMLGGGLLLAWRMRKSK